MAMCRKWRFSVPNLGRAYDHQSGGGWQKRPRPCREGCHLSRVAEAMAALEDPLAAEVVGSNIQAAGEASRAGMKALLDHDKARHRATGKALAFAGACHHSRQMTSEGRVRIVCVQILLLLDRSAARPCHEKHLNPSLSGIDML